MFAHFSLNKNGIPSTVDAANMSKKQNLRHLPTAIEELKESVGKMKSRLKLQLQNLI